MGDQSGRNWKETIQLPRSDFPMRAGLTSREPEAIARWEEADIYHRMREVREGREPFILHDGPPYANGDIHHGHALNKILKDIVVKYRAMSGRHVSFIPGWDCHGLPIEHNVDKELGEKKAKIDTVGFRKACRDYAARYVDKQGEQFRRLMAFAEWERPYRTMDFAYEASIVERLGRFVERGYVYKGLKPVHWSWGARTALAEAEVEYAPYTAPSVYVKFPFDDVPDWLEEAAGDRAIHVVIWTTTPWTIPSNLAIVLHPELEYRLLALDDDEAIIIAAGLQESVLDACDLGELDTLVGFKGQRLVGTTEDPEPPRPVARHPFIDRNSVLLPADYVTLEQGTGCVHTAPGHGQEDFETGRKYGLDVLAPVDAEGRYTAEVPDYEGMHVFDANPLIAQRLADTGRLLNQPGDRYEVARYPHCWRTKTPVIFRATAQWFIDVDHDGLRQRALDGVSQTQWIPEWGENRIHGMLETRPDWCISRQRVWGVPIPAFRCGSCGEHILEAEVVFHVAELTAESGCDVWFEREAEELTPDGFACPHCGGGVDGFDKEQDILDVWFDSGVSWSAVLRDREGIEQRADLYLEGSDQHRGWFHTSLLCGVATADEPPFEAVLTHGFVVDENGHKFSKSSPSYEPLDKMLERNGAEILRIWVAAVDYRQDMTMAKGLLQQVSDTYRKIRNTFRFLLGNLTDYDPAAHSLDVDALAPLDRWALGEVASFATSARSAYEGYAFHLVQQQLLDHCNLFLSAVYLDALKDRLYCALPDDPRRRQAQAVLYEALRQLVHLAAPILTFTADEVWQHMPRRDGDPEFVFLSDIPVAPASWHDDAASRLVERWLELRSRVHTEIEARRPKKRGEKKPGQIGSSQEAAVTLTASPKRIEGLRGHEDELAELFIVSRVVVEEGAAADDSGVDVAVDAAETDKCPRCWNFREDIGSTPDYPALCARCATVVEAIDAAAN